MAEHCKICDRPDCKRQSTAAAYDVVARAWILEQEFDEDRGHDATNDRSTLQSAVDKAYHQLALANSDCERHIVDWRARALAAEVRRG